MTRRIFSGIFIVSLIAVLASALMVVMITYNSAKAIFTRQLEEEADLLFVTMEYTAPSVDIENLAKLTGFRNRVTYIAPDGTVLYDNMADPTKMENHLNREEVIAAKEHGGGTAVRISETLSENTIYCARELADGCVVRVSGSQDTPLTVFLGMWWEIAIILLAAVLISLLLARVISRSIVKPINSIDLKNPDIDESYGEVAPLLHRINDQNREIDKRIEELSRSRTEFNLITENMSEGLVVADKHGNVLSCNKAGREILGIEGEIVSRSIVTLSRAESFMKAAETALGGRGSQLHLELREKTYQLFASPVQGGGMVMIIMDITEKEQRETLRREFTSNVSHELKTPLTSIYGISDMLVGGIVKPEDVGQFAANIRDESGRLITLIEDIIKLSRMDENSFTDRREQVDMYSTVKLAAERLATSAEKKQVLITVTGEPAVVMGIPAILDEMVYNLIDNAVKYNREGGSVNAEVKSTETTVTVTVSDSGIGIPQESLSRIFERFYRADKSHSKLVGGTGLGLSIVKHAAVMHGGSVSVTSTEGEGSRFTSVLPKSILPHSDL